jgi:hypothetical protein
MGVRPCRVCVQEYIKNIFTAIFLETNIILLREHVALLRFRIRDKCSKEQIRNNVTGFFDIRIIQVSGFNGEFISGPPYIPQKHSR